MTCQCCGVEAPTKYVEFYQSIGALFAFYPKQVQGNLCKSCIEKYFWRYTLISLTLGWWSVISFFVTPVFILCNLIHYLKTLRLRSVLDGVNSRESVSVGINSQTRRKPRINRTGRSHISESSQKSHLNANSSKQSVRERGRRWYNSEHDQPSLPSLPQESEPSDASSIEDLIKHLGCANNSGFRCLAAELLGQKGSTATPAISALLIAGVDIDATVRKAALNALKSIDPHWFQNSEVQKALPKLAKEFKQSYCFKKSYSEEVSKAADKLLRQIGKPAVPYLANLIVEEEDKVEYKIQAIWILRDIGSDATSAVPQLIQALSSKASKVRIAAAKVLANFRTAAKAAIPDILVGLADRDVDVREAMVTCLVAIEPEVPDLLPFLVHKNPNVSEAVADALIQIRPQALPALIGVVLQWCTNSKANTDNGETDQKITEAVLQVLGKFGSDASVAMPTIALALVDPNPSIKLAAVRTLGNIDRNWLSDPAIVKAIVSFAGGEAAIPELIVGLADRNKDVRKAMMGCLAQFGAEAKPAVPKLRPLLTDLDPKVQKAAADALMRIDPQPTVTERHAASPSRNTGGKYFRPEPSASAQTSHVPSKSSSQLHPLKRQLLTLLQGDSQACQRLIELERRKRPQSTEDELYKNVIAQLERDRR